MTRQPKTWPVELLGPKGDCEGWIIDSWQHREGKWFTKLRDTELRLIGGMQKDGCLPLKKYIGEGATEREAVGDTLEAINSYLKEKQRGWSARLV